MRSQYLSTLAPCLWAATRVAAVGVNDFDWETITPSHKLEYHPCYETFQCARLTVPLDWLDENHTNPHTVAVAITRLPATVPDTDPAFGGDIFTNPGGPGGSGVAHVLRHGPLLRDLTSSGERRHAVLSWDPRGVGFTSPKADCYGGDVAARDLAEVEGRAVGHLLGDGDAAMRRQWARARAYGRLCTRSVEAAAENGSFSILPYLTTPSVVRDMVAILDQIGELKNKEDVAEETMQMDDNDDAQRRLELRGAEKIEKRKQKKKKQEVQRLLYWGFSYGTLLGNMFASMFPGRVGRVILDGVVDADDYVAGTWLSNLQDTEKIVERFYQLCFEANDACPLRRGSDTRWEDLRTRVDALVDQANEEPLSVLEGNTIVDITGTDIVSAFRRPLYAPLDDFARLAEVLAGALDGNTTGLLAYIRADGPRLHDTCGAPPNRSARATLSDADASHGIKCTDGEDATGLALADFRAVFARLRAQSPTFAAYWATIQFGCAGFAVRSAYRFTGPFTTPPALTLGGGGDGVGGAHGDGLDDDEQDRPAAPLLFLTTRLDPVTPLRNARNMAARHPGAAVVVQEGQGHCSLSAPSKCTSAIVRRYLATGEVPDGEAVCESDCGPWEVCEQDVEGSVFRLSREAGWPLFI